MEPWFSPNPHSPAFWSMVAGVAGRTLVIVAACLFGVSVTSWLAAPRSRVGSVAGVAGTVAVFGALACLAVLFTEAQFQFQYVWSHCDLQTPFAYRLAGVWSGQEGSFLLWACCTAGFGVAAARSAGGYRRWFSVAVGATMLGLCLILVLLDPFGPTRVDGALLNPKDGVGMSPALLNFWVTIHPPVIFIGFGLLIVPFAYAFAALVSDDLGTWIAPVRPWALAGATTVGFGLCLGGFWAYETLGWGGFWAWDPVENVSFVPWMLGLALIHGLRVQAVRGRWVFGNLLMAAAPFVAFVYGTYLTRSGLLAQASVHSFAEMQSAALHVLLGLLVLAASVFLGLWVWRFVQTPPDPCNAAEQPEQGVHREGVMRYGVILLVLIGLVALAGMSVPAIGSLSGKVLPAPSEDIYHRVLVWLFAPLMLLLAVAPFAGWRPQALKSVAGRLYYTACLTFGAVGLTMFLVRRSALGDNLGLSARHETLFGGSLPGYAWTVFYFGLCLFALLGAVWVLVAERGSFRAVGPGLLSHAGMAILLVGMIVSRSFELKDHALVQAGRPGEVLGLRFEFKGETAQPTDRGNEVLFEVQGESRSFIASPGLYYHAGPDGSQSAMTWPHIERFPLHDVYISVQPADDFDPVQAHYRRPIYRVDAMMKPLTGAVWLGVVLITVAGLMAAFNVLRRKT